MARELASRRHLIDDGEEDQSTRGWVWIFVFFLLAFSVATIAIVVIAIYETDEDLPKKIDAVIHVTGEDNSMGRDVYQVRSIQKRMKWIENIYVLVPTNEHKQAVIQDKNVHYLVTGKLTPEEAFLHVPSISGINEYAMFMGHQTLPANKIRKTYMFHGSQPRMFNVMRESSEATFFSQYFENQETPTMPTLPMKVSILKQSKSMKDYIFRQTTEDPVVLRLSMNRDLLITNNESNVDKQLKELDDRKPLFMTFHVTANKSNAYKKVNTYLEGKFPA